MRIAVRYQLSLLLILSTSIGLATLAVATWIANYDFVLNVARNGLEAAAALKAADIAVSLDLMYTSCLYLTASGPLQQALLRYNNGSNTTEENWQVAAAGLAAAVSSVGFLRHTPAIQSQLRAASTSGPAGNESVLNITGAGNEGIVLPWRNADGSPLHLGQGSLGYPPALYPNLTISEQQDNHSAASYLATYNGNTLGLHSNLVLGPLTINENLSLMSMTVPVIENNSETNVLGWLTIVQDARLVQRVVEDRTGLGETGVSLLLGPVNTTNKFPAGALGSDYAKQVRYLLPVAPSAASRHTSVTVNAPFPASAYPAIATVISEGFHGTRELGSMLRTHNEDGEKVSIAYSTPPTEIVNWIVVVERTTGDVWQPITHLRTIILACLFSVLGFFFFASLPIADWAVRPITRLRVATESTIDPLYAGSSSNRSIDRAVNEGAPSTSPVAARKAGCFERILRWHRKKRADSRSENHWGHEKRFRIPSKVDTSKHWVKDDLSDLIGTFNEMSDELFLQYSKLEDRVRQRTTELEQSKKVAEAANESKTLFVANVSHELKTPLNGILGMCATSIEEDDIQQMKTSLGIIHKSGDLLLRTLNDLLTFSTNQIGSRELMLEEREFTVQDLESQILTIFQKQAMDKNIKLRVQFEEASPSLFGTPGGLKDMTLWGDVHRILQIIINLVSNSLKYTPADGSVTFVVRRSSDPAPRHLLSELEQSSVRSQRTRGSDMRRSNRGGTANFINPIESPQLQERSVAPAGNDFYVELEVRDTGQGIPEDMQSRIFEPFVQGEVGLNRRHSGTGLGLSICSQLAGLLRGSINLKSTLGQGSAFTVKIPLRHVMATPTTKASQDVARTESRPISLAGSEKVTKTDSEKGTDSELASAQRQAQTNGGGIPVAVAPHSEPKDEAPKAKPNETQPAHVSREQNDPPSKAVKKARVGSKDDKEAGEHDLSRIRVLVAEDNKVNQQVILRMLKMEQILQVAIAEDGQQALDLVKTLHGPESADSPPYDLIFMDIQMPIMDGLTSTRLIRESGFQGPIVALTAFAEKSNVDDCYQSGMNHFLAKPLQRPQLHEVLIRLCSHKVETRVD